MLIALHKNARTTPAVRAEIAASDEPASVLAQRFGITEQTVYASAQAFLKALHKACPIRINKLLTDNGKEFTDRLFASRPSSTVNRVSH